MNDKTNQYVHSFNQPTERRDFKAHGHLDLVQLGDVSIGRAEFEPGWKWVDDVKPIAQTETCEAPHAGYCLAGSMVIRMNDGTQFTIRAGDAFQIPPGHTAWVEGPEKCVLIDVTGYKNYAKKAQPAQLDQAA